MLAASVVGLIVVVIVAQAADWARARRHERMRAVALDICDGVDVPTPSGEADIVALSGIAVHLSTSLRGTDRAMLGDWLHRHGFPARARVWMHDRDPAVRLRGIALATAIGGERLLALLPDLLYDPHRRVRGGAARAMGLVGVRESIPILFEAAEESRVPVGTAATAILRIFPRNAEDLGRAFSSSSADVRRIAADIAGHVELFDARESLEMLVSDPMPAVRGAAVRALVRLDDPRSIDVLTERIAFDGVEATERELLARAVARLAGAATA